MKLCKKCGVSDYTPSGHCRPCTTAARKKWRLENPERNRDVQLRWQRKGWAPGEHERAEAARPDAGYRCPVCWTDAPKGGKWVADHNHVTGKFRGYLCTPCNIFVGYVEKFRKNPGHVTSYLRRYRRCD